MDRFFDEIDMRIIMVSKELFLQQGIAQTEMKVIAERSERASTMITTNLEFSRWPDMFANETLVAALVDRLTYHSHVLNMNGASFRLDSHQMR